MQLPLEVADTMMRALVSAARISSKSGTAPNVAQ